MNVVCLSGFNPCNIDSWKINQYHPYAVHLPQKRNWTRRDLEYVANWYTAHYGNEPYVLTCHSDGGTIAHELAHTDERCVGLHAHAALFFRPKQLRSIPVLLTWNAWDLTGMGLVSRYALSYYLDHISEITSLKHIIYDHSAFNSHTYTTCVEDVNEFINDLKHSNK